MCLIASNRKLIHLSYMCSQWEGEVARAEADGDREKSGVGSVARSDSVFSIRPTIGTMMINQAK